MKSSNILCWHNDSPEFNRHFHYCSIIGKMAYIEQGLQPDISFALNACSCYAHNLKQPHRMAVKHIGHYVAKTHKQGLVLRPEKTVLSIFTLMPVFVATGTKMTQLMMIQVLPNPGPALSSCMQIVQSSGNCIYKH